jgi:hypothetical protein
MPRFPLLALLAVLLAAMPLAAAPKTVCTITVNSDDEKEAMRARLPKGQYEFVELVEKGRPDWLRSSCQKKVRCDVLVVSGHFNAGDDFYSDRLEKNEFLRVEELERASCSDSCPGLFSQLKEVYLFGCDSMKAVGDGDGGESSRERMQRIFAGVPAIYGFSSAAPVGPTAAMLLNKYFDGGAHAFGSGRPDARMLRMFSRNSMTLTPGLRGEESASRRRQVCTFYDERLAAAEKLRKVHAMMRRDLGEARQYFGRIEKLTQSLGEAERSSPAFSQALAEISADDATRERFLAAARASKPAMRARMASVAGTLGWLSADGLREENVALAADVLERPTLGFAEVDLVCTLGKDGYLESAVGRLKAAAGSSATRATHAAALACAGDVESQGRAVRALASRDAADVQMAQLYLRHRPLADATALRAAARDVARMPASSAKVRALDTLGRQRISDREILEEMARSFAASRSVDEQRAIAEVFLRSDPRAFSRRQVADTLRDHRLRAPDGREDLIDVAIRRLEAS